MTYLDLINQFWQKDLEFSFTSTEVNVYFRLLERCNRLGWKSPFNLSGDQLMAQLKLHTKKPFDTARKKLREAGLIDFKNGNGRGCTTEYTIVGAGSNPKLTEKKGKKNTPLSAPLSGRVLGPVSGTDSGLLHKTKTRLDKEEADASGASAKFLAQNKEPESKHASVYNSPEAEAVQQFVPTLAKLWHITEAKNYQSWAKLTRFALAIAKQGRLAELQEQFAGFRSFFLEANLTPHNLNKFTGSEGSDTPYSNGTWCESDWVAKAKERTSNPLNGAIPVPTRASASPSNTTKTFR